MTLYTLRSILFIEYILNSMHMQENIYCINTVAGGNTGSTDTVWCFLLSGYIIIICTFSFFRSVTFWSLHNVGGLKFQMEKKGYNILQNTCHKWNWIVWFANSLWTLLVLHQILWLDYKFATADVFITFFILISVTKHGTIYTLLSLLSYISKLVTQSIYFDGTILLTAAIKIKKHLQWQY